MFGNIIQMKVTAGANILRQKYICPRHRGRQCGLSSACEQEWWGAKLPWKPWKPSRALLKSSGPCPAASVLPCPRLNQGACGGLPQAELFLISPTMGCDQSHCQLLRVRCKDPFSPWHRNLLSRSHLKIQPSAYHYGLQMIIPSFSKFLGECTK